MDTREAILDFFCPIQPVNLNRISKVIEEIGIYNLDPIYDEWDKLREDVPLAEHYELDYDTAFLNALIKMFAEEIYMDEDEVQDLLYVDYSFLSAEIVYASQEAKETILKKYNELLKDTPSVKDNKLIQYILKCNAQS